jgi:hypothetical protein
MSTRGRRWALLLASAIPSCSVEYIADDAAYRCKRSPAACDAGGAATGGTSGTGSAPGGTAGASGGVGATGGSAGAEAGGAPGGGGALTGGASGGGGSGGCIPSLCGTADPCFDWACASGACEKLNKATGTPCGQTCVGTELDKRACDSGSCVLTTTSCGAYACGASKIDCNTSCASNVDCAPSFTCTSPSCVPCRTCGDWLKGVSTPPLICSAGGSCAQWSNLKNTCCTSATCQSDCSGAGDFCVTGSTVCFSSSAPSPGCLSCLTTTSPCSSYVTLCEQDNGH